ncbi:uncharacterized protein LOC125494805 [Beta vulgaris subsp. vulgaris]|uniref:uncharacterized protein LOC125494805 n=1 Tax=Beta vulgaris subsp. vulgaris TaxID=3555 RepID=UPI002548AD9B|nr:uncharacterized protein LOC125494805 [Beta vulgaris subsp. vulgaris]
MAGASIIGTFGGQGGGQFSGLGGHRDGQVSAGIQQSILTGQGQKDGFFTQLLTRGNGLSILSKGMLSPLKSQPQNQEREPEPEPDPEPEPEPEPYVVRWPENVVTQQEPELHYQLPDPSPTSIHLREMDYDAKPISEHKLPQVYHDLLVDFDVLD